MRRILPLLLLALASSAPAANSGGVRSRPFSRPSGAFADAGHILDVLRDHEPELSAFTQASVLLKAELFLREAPGEYELTVAPEESRLVFRSKAGAREAFSISYAGSSPDLRTSSVDEAHIVQRLTRLLGEPGDPRRIEQILAAFDGTATLPTRTLDPEAETVAADLGPASRADAPPAATLAHAGSGEDVTVREEPPGPPDVHSRVREIRRSLRSGFFSDAIRRLGEFQEQVPPNEHPPLGAILEIEIPKARRLLLKDIEDASGLSRQAQVLRAQGQHLYLSALLDNLKADRPVFDGVFPDGRIVPKRVDEEFAGRFAEGAFDYLSGLEEKTQDEAFLRTRNRAYLAPLPRLIPWAILVSVLAAALAVRFEFPLVLALAGLAPFAAYLSPRFMSPFHEKALVLTAIEEGFEPRVDAAPGGRPQ